MKFSEALFAHPLVMRERMGEEIREMRYERRVGVAHGNFLPAYGLSTVQGRLWR